jgi:predicted phosphodiesterase
MTEPELSAAAALRALGWGDRPIADALGLTYHTVRSARERGMEPTPPGLDGYTTTVIVSDTQYPWVHEPSEKVCQAFIRDTQPDAVIQIGDMMDLYSLARFRKNMSLDDRYEVGGTLMQEVELGRRKLSEWRALAPNAKYTWIEGNHEARLARYSEDFGGELFGLDTLTIPEVFQTQARGWDYIGPWGQGMWVGNEGGLWATHGDFARKWSGYSAKAHVEAFAHSVIHGHTHRLGAYYQTGAERMVAGFEVGCLCDRNATPRAVPVVNWQTGFAVVYTDDNGTDFWVNLVNIEHHHDGHATAVYGGKVYRS